MRRFPVVALLLSALLLGGPIMACAVRDAQLSAAEKQCCKQMAGECQRTGSGMPASHSCCKTEVRPQSDLLPSASVSISTPPLVAAALDLPIEAPQAQNFSSFGSWLVRSHDPPGNPLDASAPLRI